MEYGQKQYIPGLDLLKFILAVLIISAHCHLYIEYPRLYNWWSAINGIAVPLFFGISSYFFFRKIYSSKATNTHAILIHSIKRLVILFACWYVLMIPMTYLRFYSVATLKETIYAIFLSCCFNGYWFIKALIINTIILYVCRTRKKLITCTAFALGIYFYCAYNYIFHYNPSLESLHPYYSFYYHTAYFCMGALFAHFQDHLCFWKWRTDILIIAWFIILLLTPFPIVNPIFRLSSFFFIFPVFYIKEFTLSQSKCKYLRNMSIILYMVQFILIWIYNGACDKWLVQNETIYTILQFSVTRFLIITSAAVFLAWTILTLEKRPRLKLLRYLH